MVKLLILLSAFALIASAIGSDVLVYTDSDFDTKIQSHPVALVEFYAPWCGHCKKLAPEYETAASTLLETDPDIALVKVDCTVETKVCAKHGVNGYPTLKIFKNGEFSADYAGPRESDGIIRYMRTKAGPVSRELKSEAEAQKFLANHEHSIVGYFSNMESPAAREFLKVADQLAESNRFAHTSQPELLANHKDEVVVFQPPRLQVKLAPSESVLSLSDKSTQNQIKQFIQEEMHGICGHRTSGNAKDFKSPLVVVYYNVDYVKDIKGTNYVRNRIIKVAQKLKAEGISQNKITFAISSVIEYTSELSESYGLNVNPAVKYVIGLGEQGQKYVYQGEYSVEGLEQFARDLLAGKLEQFLKSEPVPDYASSTDKVVTVVAKNFEEIVNNEDKDVLIEFYAPWCGHCKTLAPKYEELAKKLADESDIVIAKMDATANDVPANFEVKGFPTLFFVPKSNVPRKYEGGREIDDFVKYLAKESTDPLKSYKRNGAATKSNSDL
jgi:protein disulfide isomerase family A protein 3